MNTSKLTQQRQVLGYAGLLPFLLFALMALHVIPSPVSDPHYYFSLYSAVILSFMAGTLWRSRADSAPILSNIFALVAFLSLLLPAKFDLMVLSVSYLVLYSFEFKVIHPQSKVGSNPYQKFRLILTSIVFLLHLLLLTFK